MKTSSLRIALVVAAALAGPLDCFAQSDAPITRSQVKAELRQIEQAGYDPARAEDANYPADVQAAEARLNQKPLASSPDSQGADGSITGSARTHDVEPH